MCWTKIIHPSFPKSKGKITGDEVYTMLMDFSHAPVYISDDKFDLCTVEEAKAYLKTQEMTPYLAEGHDCDNFSFASMGYFSQGLYSFAYGIAWSLTHAFNFHIDERGNLWIVEPQSNTFMTVEEAKSKGDMYFPIRFMLL